jgi:hypothetical protein
MNWMLRVHLKAFYDIALVQLIMDETNIYTEQKILKC